LGNDFDMSSVQGGPGSVQGGYTQGGPGRVNREVLILGAGFSRAISPAMPSTDELGVEAIALAGLQDDRRVPAGFTDGTFEIWLSRLAEDQPYLTETENLENRALFSRLSGAIHDVLQARQLEALRREAPSWLYEFVSALHVRRATAITLNYDNLMECAVDALQPWDWETGNNVQGIDVLDGIPPYWESGRWIHTETFGLLKLHGSLSWYGVPNDDTAATLASWSNPGTFGAPLEVDQRALRQALPGRRPLSFRQLRRSPPTIGTRLPGSCGLGPSRHSERPDKSLFSATPFHSAI
jgi:hypothetical protein